MMERTEIFQCIKCKCKRTLAHFGGLEGSSSNWRNHTTCTDCKAGRPVGLVWCVIGQHERPRADFVFPDDSCYICVEAASPGKLRDRYMKRHKSLFQAIPEDEAIEWMQGAFEDLQCKAPRARTKLFFEDIPLVPIIKDGNAQRGMDTVQRTIHDGEVMVKCAFGHHYKAAEYFDIGKKICKECSQKRRRAERAANENQITLEEMSLRQLDCERPQLSHTIRPSTVPHEAETARTRLLFDDIPMVNSTNNNHDGNGPEESFIKCAQRHHFKPASDFDIGRKSCRECLEMLAAKRRATKNSHLGCPPTQGPGISLDENMMDSTDPLDAPALSPDDQALLLNFRKALKKINMEHCPLCDERWFDTNVKDVQGVHGCERCRKDIQPIRKYSKENAMQPGRLPVSPKLPKLTQLEEQLISPVHVVIQLRRVKGLQYKYSSHIFNVFQNTAKFFGTLPLLPSDLEVILLKPRRREGAQETTNHRESSNNEFRVRRGAIMVWLEYLSTHHPTFQQSENSAITISQPRINNLPHCDSIYDKLGSVEEAEIVMEVENRLQNDTLNECALEPTLVVNEYMIPNLSTSISEEERTRSRFDRSNHQEPLSMPTLASRRINKFSDEPYIADAFPTLFPDGEADLKAHRVHPVTPKEYFSHLLRLSDPRFAQHPRFRWFAANSMMRWQAKSQGNFYAQRKHLHEGQITVEDLMHQFENNQEGLAREIVHYGKNIRGTRPYWSNVRSDLLAMVQDPEVGCPNVFFTVSAADHQWPDLQRLMPIQYDNEETESRKAQIRTQNLVENPHIVAYYIHRRLFLFLDLVMRKKWPVVDFWVRFEWQSRGTGHAYGFMWFPQLEGIPNPATLDFSREADAQKFLEYWKDDYTALNPAPDLDPAGVHPCAIDTDCLIDSKRELAEMLNTVQYHGRCRAGSCYRRNKKTGEVHCRFNFPKEVRSEAQMVKDQKGNWTMEPARNGDRINAFNPLMSLGWRANIDFKPVTTLHSVLKYITKYVSKPEYKSDTYIHLVQSVFADMSSDARARDGVARVLNKLIAERDYSAQEVMHHLLDLKLFKSSRDVVSINVQPLIEQRVQLNMEASARMVNFGRTAMEYYMERETVAENLSFAEILRDFTRQPSKDVNGKWPYHRRTRGKSLVLKIYPRYSPNPRSPQFLDHCRAKMWLHHPFRSLDEMLKRPGQRDLMTWIEAYEQCNAQHDHQVPDSLDEFSTLADLEDGEDSDSEDISVDGSEEPLSEGMQHARGVVMEGHNVECSKEFNNDLGQRDIDIGHDWGASTNRYADLMEAQTYIKDQRRQAGDEDTSDINHALDLMSLTVEQRRIFDHFMDHDISGSTTPFRINIDGVGGTGKSFLIGAISHGLASRRSPGSPSSIRRLAPTGVVAFAIRGETYHSALSIRPRQSFEPLQGSALLRLQKRWKHVKYLIIDEKSMIGLRAFGRIDRRLRQAFPNSSDEFFGGVSTSLGGDFGQLGPVGDRSLFCELAGLSGEALAEALQGKEAYLSFATSITLTRVMRQIGEDEEQKRFREFLSRLRDRCCTIDDWKLLLTRFRVDRNGRPKLSASDVEYMKDASRLFPTRSAVASFNEAVLRESGRPVRRLIAKHPSGGRDARKASDDEAGGLAQQLLFSVGSKVMLTQNLWTQQGLVNGISGVIEDIVWLDPMDVGNLPTLMFVAMKDYKGPTLWRTPTGTPIVPIPASLNTWEKVTLSGSKTLSREQFPLCLADAITVHKSQGATMDKAVLDLSGVEFSAGLAYVAVSRVKTLRGLMFEKYFTHERICPSNPGALLRQRLADEERRRMLESL